MNLLPPVPVNLLRRDGDARIYVQRETVTYVEHDSTVEQGFILRVHFVGGSSLIARDDVLGRESLGLPPVEMIGGRQAKRGHVERERGRDGA